MRYPNSLQQPTESRGHCCRENRGCGGQRRCRWGAGSCHLEQLRFVETVLDRIDGGTSLRSP
jgi:hypothetical protein